MRKSFVSSICVAMMMILLASSAVLAINPEPPPGPPTVIWVTQGQFPTSIEAGGKDTLGIIYFHVMQSTYLLDADVDVKVGKVNNITYSNLGVLLEPGLHKLVIKGIVPACNQKGRGYISWQLTELIAIDGNGMPIQFVVGLPIGGSSSVTK